ncbi:hypothetical protein [Amycolatopsis sp. BJA-103]|uniref:hypothetical protein n=1 Tax=Amycolatopsis sp. BJA-103 TaxID=1911175 RepID=UPI000C76E925|nr:hypothetical protein [Amycolatopsis sp. BJA-103]AUI57320.1 hypothetical protein BKN51_03220 [Amycolatopsis sp. BJA-103]PNE13252.1 hypothetical protein B1H26_41405 [Amycolatopsis sp. BJA-103]
MATEIYHRFEALYHERYPNTGPVTEKNLATLMISLPEIDLDIDTMKVVLRPESRVAPWSQYASALRALTNDDDTVTWFNNIHGKLAVLLPDWSSPPRDIAAITDDAEFMATIRRLRETPRPIPVAELSRKMRDRDGKNYWQRTQLGENLKKKTLPDNKPFHVRNLLETLCDNAGRPTTDADHLFATWQRLRRPKTYTQPEAYEQPEVVLASKPIVDPPPQPDIKLPGAPIEPRWPLSKTLLILGVAAIAFIIVVITVL